MSRAVDRWWDLILGWRWSTSISGEVISDLRSDPLGRLERNPIVIRRMRVWPFVGLAPLMLFAVVYLRDSNHLIAAFVAGACGLIVAIVYGWSMPNELRLERDGLLLRRRHLEIVCGWEVFDAPGRPLRSRWWAVLPVNPRELDLVGMWQKGEQVARGLEVRTDFFKFDAPDQLRIAGLDLAPQDLGELIQFIAESRRRQRNDD